MRLQGFQSQACRFTRRQKHQTFDLNGYCRRIQDVRSTGAFPNLESFLIISKRRLGGANSQNSASRWAVYAKDLTGNQTVIFPRVFLELPSDIPRGVTRTYSPRALIRIPEKCSFMPTWLLGNEYVGGSGGIRRLCEGLAGWEAFRSGPIIPRLRVRDYQTAINQGYIKRWYEPETSAYFRQRTTLSCDLWEEEEAAGVRLLEPVVYKGVTTDIPLAKRVVPKLEN
ncbi:hypothetical protein EG328_002633 [Venturia inaequalis]|uniref:Uncharacterized protein n=1 Tax=Venturia inaequalis TaxID=5025 RepID=A0A8H3Z1F7_VENIN|nr:hypothetical protein EG328_002633 [Venturia inaequalis]